MEREDFGVEGAGLGIGVSVLVEAVPEGLFLYQLISFSKPTHLTKKK